MSAINRLPSLPALIFFEAAARHLNFTAAAEELGTSQPAVSQRINQLERELGVALFERRHRGVLLTPEGDRLYHIVYSSLTDISQQIEKIKKKKTRDTLRIDTDMGFASYWLLPRLDKLQRLMPDVDVQISTSPNDFNLRDSHANLSITFGNGHWPGCHSEKLFPELVVPVCTPEFIRRYGPLDTPQSLLKVPLLNLPETNPSRWLTWYDWFGSQRIILDNSVASLTFNAYSLLIEAALKGKGVALGWMPLVGQLLDDGELVIPCGPEVKTERGYYLIQSQRDSESALYHRVKEWLINESFSFKSRHESYFQPQG